MKDSIYYQEVDINCRDDGWKGLVERFGKTIEHIIPNPFSPGASEIKNARSVELLHSQLEALHAKVGLLVLLDR